MTGADPWLTFEHDNFKYEFYSPEEAKGFCFIIAWNSLDHPDERTDDLNWLRAARDAAREQEREGLARACDVYVRNLEERTTA